MLTGWVLSALGEQLVQGSSQGLVATGLLPAAWVAAYTTVGTLEDVFAPLVVRPLSRFRPGGVLVACELVDAVLLVAALTAGGLGAPTPWVVVVYLLLTSPIPLVLDVSEELYGEEMARFDPEVSYGFTIRLHSLTALVQRVVALPAGVWLTAVAVEILLAANLVLTLAALVLRLRGSRDELLLVRAGPVEEHSAVSDAGAGHRADKTDRLRDLVTDPFVSPVPVLLRSFAGAAAGTYVLLAVSQAWSYTSYVLALVMCGLGATAGPLVTQWLRRRVGVLRGLRLAAGVTGLCCLGALLGFRADMMWLALSTLCVAEAGAWAVSSGLIAERQTRAHGELFVRATVWAQGAGALGALIGVWTALEVGGAQEPVRLLGIAVVTWVLFVVLTVRPPRRGQAGDVRSSHR